MVKLLIVDDEPDVREFASNFFRKRKFKIYSCPDGESAIDMVENEQPDLVLLDIKLNRMDGIEALRKIREKNKQVKVIMMTGRDDEEAKRSCGALGVSGYLHKPLELDELEKIVAGAVGTGI